MHYCRWNYRSIFIQICVVGSKRTHAFWNKDADILGGSLDRGRQTPFWWSTRAILSQGNRTMPLSNTIN